MKAIIFLSLIIFSCGQLPTETETESDQVQRMTQYDDAGQLVEYHIYTYSENLNIVKEYNKFDVLTMEYRYQFDDHGRLISTTRLDGLGEVDYIREYSY